MSPLTPWSSLEARSIHLLREAVAEARRPVLLLGSGLPSRVLQRLAIRAFHPAPMPLPALPLGPAGLPADDQALHPSLHPSLQQALLAQGFDLAIVAEPLDDLADAIGPAAQVPADADPAAVTQPAQPTPWPLYNLRPRPGQALIVRPLDGWTKADLLRHGQPPGPQGTRPSSTPASPRGGQPPGLQATRLPSPANAPLPKPTGFRATVQSVHRVQPEPANDPAAPPDADPTCYAVLLCAGTLHPGDLLQALPSGQTSRINRLIGPDGDLPQAQAGQALMLTLADPIALQRGDLLCPASAATDTSADPRPQLAHQFEATLHWLGDQPLLRGRAYRLHTGSRTVTATVLPLKYRLDPATHSHLAAETLARGELGVAELDLDQPIAFDPPGHHPGAGRFILIDRISQATVASGQLHFALRRASNIHWQAVSVDRAARQRLNGHGSAVVWLTGLSGAGKSTIANLLEKRLHADGQHTYLLDGDNLRHGLNKDLGFTAADRVENIRRVAEVARLMADAGLIVVTAFISPFRAERAMARALMAEGEFIEVHVDTPLAVAESRDPKGLYKKARRGELKNFTGIDSPYEAPESPELRLDTSLLSAEAAVAQIHALLRQRGVLDAPAPSGGPA